MSKIDEGFVKLELLDRDGESETLHLKPTLAAIRAISQRFGDIQTAMQRVVVRDWHAILFVVVHGLAIQGDKKAQNRIEDRIFRTGIGAVATSALEYVGVLQNGGRPLDDGGGEDETDDADASAEGNG